jgi:hypothetical protein
MVCTLGGIIRRTISSSLISEIKIASTVERTNSHYYGVIVHCYYAH